MTAVRLFEVIAVAPLRVTTAGHLIGLPRDAPLRPVDTIIPTPPATLCGAPYRGSVRRDLWTDPICAECATLELEA